MGFALCGLYDKDISSQDLDSTAGVHLKNSTKGELFTIISKDNGVYLEVSCKEGDASK